MGRPPGHLGVQRAREGGGITVSCWVDDAAADVEQVADHLVVRCPDSRIRTATVHREHGTPAYSPGA